MRRFDKTINIDKANLLAEQRYLGQNSLSEDEVSEFLLEIQNEIYECLGVKQPLDESVILEAIKLVKDLLTSHRISELATAFVKLIYKWLGIDKDLSGSADKCDDKEHLEKTRADGESKGFTMVGECKQLLIQKISDKLLAVHKTMVKLFNWVAAAIKFRTFKPTNEQKKASEKLGKIILTTIIIGCLIYYLVSMGFAIAAGATVKASFYFMGALVKTTDLNKKFSDGVHDINVAGAAH